MYTNPNQYTGQGYQNAYAQYQQNYNSTYGYEDYGQYMNTNVQPVPPGEEYPQNSWAPVAGYTNSQQQQQQQHHGNIPSQSFDNKKEDDKKEALAQEIKQQNAQLIKQREDYVRKAAVLRRELDLLRNQKKDIMSEKSPQRDMELILKENDKLQDEIQSKMKAIYNVIEMLSSIIKDGRKISDLEAQLNNESPKIQQYHHHHQQQQHHHQQKNYHQHLYSETLENTTKFNYIHYDPELHWCRMCDEFPKTAKDFLLHLQSDKHMENIQKTDVGDNTPWHKLPPEPELPCYEGAPKKRIPIRGLQFFISAPSWYCKLCDTWIGDLHCASQHLKSQSHFQNYANFVEQNPHWEIEWLKDREKAMARSDKINSSDSEERESNKKRRKHKNKRSSIDQSIKDKKKKKRSKKRSRKHSSDSSSSSSSSDTTTDDEELNDKSKSIRVAMRNMKVQSIMNEDLNGKWEMLERMVDEHKKKEEEQKQQQQKLKDFNEDKLINQWNTIINEPEDKERILLDNLKDRMKQKQEIEKARYAEIERRQREKEREERELHDRKLREEQETRERFERERREREREEYEHIRDKDRNQVRFKTTTRENYRRRRTPSKSPTEPSQRSSSGRHSSPSSRRDNSDKHYRQRHHSPREQQHNGRDKKRSRSRSNERNSSKYDTDDDNNKKKQPPGPPKRLPFIGRMPLFKNKKPDDKVEKEIKKEEYDIPRQTRFQPGNLARAFLPQPDVVCFPKLSSYPPISAPPPPPIVSQPDPPAPPKISEGKLKAPPAPKIGNTTDNSNSTNENEDKNQEVVSGEIDPNMYDPNQMIDPNQYYSEMEYNMMYSQMYGYTQDEEYQSQQQPPPPPTEDVPLSHTMPLQPPPLPPSDPSDDLALLGISADDMAAQSF